MSKTSGNMELMSYGADDDSAASDGGGADSFNVPAPPPSFGSSDRGDERRRSRSKERHRSRSRSPKIADNSSSVTIVDLPVAEHPSINWQRVLGGYHGNGFKSIESNTGTNIVFRGMGVRKTGKKKQMTVGENDGRLRIEITGPFEGRISANNSIDRLIATAIDGFWGESSAPTMRPFDRVWIPQGHHPHLNFADLLNGPSGNTLKALEVESGTEIIIRGKGSIKEGKLTRKDGQPFPGENEPLHAYVTGPDRNSIKIACDRIKAIIAEASQVPDGQNNLRAPQLRELAQSSGANRPMRLADVSSDERCTNCGADNHKRWQCQQNHQQPQQGGGQRGYGFGRGAGDPPGRGGFMGGGPPTTIADLQAMGGGGQQNQQQSQQGGGQGGYAPEPPQYYFGGDYPPQPLPMAHPPACMRDWAGFAGDGQQQGGAYGVNGNQMSHSQGGDHTGFGRGAGGPPGRGGFMGGGPPTTIADLQAMGSGGQQNQQQSQQGGGQGGYGSAQQYHGGFFNNPAAAAASSGGFSAHGGGTGYAFPPPPGFPPMPHPPPLQPVPAPLPQQPSAARLPGMSEYNTLESFTSARDPPN